MNGHPPDTMPPELTQENFARLPLLLSRQEFRHWTGFSDEDVTALVQSGEVTPIRIGPRKRNKYPKAYVAMISGFRM